VQFNNLGFGLITGKGHGNNKMVYKEFYVPENSG
jgi:hypothetical protein